VTCPKCGLMNTQQATVCDCGFALGGGPGQLGVERGAQGDKNWWRLRYTDPMNRRFTRAATVCLILAAVVSLLAGGLSPNPAEVAGKLIGQIWAKALPFGLALYFTIRRIGRGLAKLICASLALAGFLTLFAVLLSPQRRAKALLVRYSNELQEDMRQAGPDNSALNVEEIFETLDGKERPTLEALSRCRQQASAALSRLDKFEKLLGTRVPEIEREISEIDADTASEFAKGMDLPRLRRTVAAEREYLTEIKALEDFLVARVDHFTVGKDGYLVFDSRQDVEMFRASVTLIDKHRKETAELASRVGRP
jgi:hypothetical protein